MKLENSEKMQNDLAHRQDGRTQDSEIGKSSTRPACSVQRLVLSCWGAFVADVPPIGWIVIAGLLMQAALVWVMLP